MLNIKDSDLCTGCGACSSVCPTDAIKIEYDYQGYLYPKVIKDKCIGCNKCNLTCPIEKDLLGERKPFSEKYYAGYLKNIDELNQVSSGGAFWAIAQNVFSLSGVVYGAIQEKTFDVHHERATSLKDAEKFRRSKYLQSYVGDTYRMAQEDLENGKIVLFSGTGCQLAGLYSFLNIQYENLITCEVVCHGVPSMKVFEHYIEVIEKRNAGKVSSINFRDKSKGWKNNSIATIFDNNKITTEYSVGNLFHKGYLKGLYYRPVCGKCKYSCLPRIGDITLADYWKYEGKLKTDNPDMGISLIITSTKRGDMMINDCSDVMIIENTEKEDSIASCKHLVQSPEESKKRAKFFRVLDKKGFEIAVNKCTKITVWDKVLRKTEIYIEKITDKQSTLL